MKRRLIIVFILLLALIIVVTIQNNKNKPKQNEDINMNFRFNINQKLINDLDKELERINLSKHKTYVKKTGEFEVEEFSIPCMIKNEQDEKGKIKTYLRLPAWIIKYTDIESQNILLSQLREDSNVNLVLKGITIAKNEIRIKDYALQEGSTNKNARIDFMFLFLEENK